MQKVTVYAGPERRRSTAPPLAPALDDFTLHALVTALIVGRDSNWYADMERNREIAARGARRATLLIEASRTEIADRPPAPIRA